MEKIRICPNCKQEMKVQVGFHNWKNLFRKPTLDELITLFIIILAIALFFAWQHDINQYKEYIAKNCNEGILVPNLNNQSVNITDNSTWQNLQKG